ncbi:hypothetical protein QJQ45_025235 [Haematococcus lacustris]|nr:hypothetical protein QJQ45_025235 [Haematococcus lacustris]
MPRLLKGGVTTVLTSGSEDEGVLQEGEGQALDALFQRYTSALSGGSQRDAVFQQGLARVREFLAGSSGDASACLICLSAIKPREAVWSCAAGCCALYHLPCIQAEQEWARNQVDQAVLKALSKLTQFPGAAAQARAAAEWGCPKCRQMYASSAIPSVYTCFCGKVEEPEWDPWRAPHSCGDLCARPLGQQLEAGRGGGGGGGCTHTCLLLCHPGPCPPCPLVVDARCYCGARTEKLRCGHHEFSWCHSGPCSACRATTTRSCHCGKLQREVACGSALQCDRRCTNMRACGRHPCKRRCCDGRSCPPCEESCGRKLRCGSAGCHDPDPPAVPPFTPPRPPRVQLLLSDTDELAAAACQVSNRSLKRSRGKAPPTALSAPGADTASPHTLPPAHQAAQAAQALLQELPEEGASRPCHCGKASLSLTCSTLQQLEHSPGRSKANGEAGSAAHTTNTAQGNAQQQQQQQQQRAEEKGSVDVLSCGRPCHRQLPHCPHACSVACHAGPCTQASRCDQEVTVRCECKRQRAKWPCARVQQALQERRGACSYDATTPLRLLACGPECERTQQAGPTQPLASSQGGLTAAGVQGRQAHDLPQGNLGAWWARVTGGQRHAPCGDPNPADTVAGSVDGGGGRDVRTVPGAVATPGVAAASRGSKHLTRAERQALADQREAVRRRAEQMQKVKAGATWLAVVLLGLLLAWVVTEVLGWLDRRLRATA